MKATHVSIKGICLAIAFGAAVFAASCAWSNDAPASVAVHLIRNDDGSVTIPASELEKLAEVVQRVEAQNSELWATVANLAKMLEIKSAQLCV